MLKEYSPFKIFKVSGITYSICMLSFSLATLIDNHNYAINTPKTEQPIRQTQKSRLETMPTIVLTGLERQLKTEYVPESD